MTVGVALPTARISRLIRKVGLNGFSIMRRLRDRQRVVHQSCGSQPRPWRLAPPGPEVDAAIRAAGELVGARHAHAARGDLFLVQEQSTVGLEQETASAGCAGGCGETAALQSDRGT